MVIVFLCPDKKQVGVKISGNKFGELKNFLKENNFFFKKIGLKDSTYDSYWVHTLATSLKDIFDDLAKIEPFVIPQEILDVIDPQPETERFRAKFDPSLLTSPPLAEYQTRAITQGIQQSRCLFAHKQGLGKTFIAFGVLNHLWNYGLVDKALILCRPEGVYNLRRELLRFNTFGLTPEDIYIADASNRYPFVESSKVVICTYRTFLMLCDDAYKKANPKSSAKKWRNAPLDLSHWGKGRALFCDESHSLKNKGARWTYATYKESAYFRFRYLMSGTPYPKGIEDLWSQFHIMDENIIGKDYYEFLSDIAVVGTKFSPYAIRFYKENNIQQFLDKTKPWIIREFATDNLDLPEQIEKRVYVNLSPKQRAIYQEFVSYRLETIKERGVDSGRFMREVYNDFPRIQMAVTDPCMLIGRVDPDKNPALFQKISKYKFEDSPRVTICDSIIEDHIEKGEKIILWSGHPQVMNHLAEHYKKYKPYLIHGEVEVPRGMSKDAYVDSVLEDFKSSPDRNLLIASYYMIATSKNIVEAKVSIYYDRSWSFVDYDQSKERNHRPGSKNDQIIIYLLLAENTIEVRQDRVLSQRKSLDEEVLNYDSLDKDTWKSIFEGGDPE